MVRKAEQEVRRAEQEVRRAEQGVCRGEQEVRRVEQEVRRAEQEVRRAEQEVRRSLSMRGEEMKIRLCDRCKEKITGVYIKCCRSEIENKKQILIHIGDLCISCWENIKGT